MEHLRPKRKAHVVLRVFKSGDIVLADLKARQTFKLNETGMKIWSLLDGTHTFEDIVSQISGEFDASADVVGSDVKTFVDGLLSMGLIET